MTLRMKAAVDGVCGADPSLNHVGRAVVSICESCQELVELTVCETFPTLPPSVVTAVCKPVHPDFKRSSYLFY
jgi:hypothetical protein